MKRGLIMEGGGMKGVFTAGVMDVLLQNHVQIDGAIGVSAGAIFGTNIKSSQIGRVIRFNKKYCRDPRYVSLKSLFFTGDIFGADFCYRQLTYELDPFDHQRFKSNPMEFYSVATNLESGKAVYHKWHTGLQEDMIWCRASASIPMLSRRVEIYDKSYLDGGVADPIPIRFFERKGYFHNIVVLTKPRDFVMQAEKILPLARICYRNYPNFIYALEKRHIVYNHTMQYINDLEKQGKIIVIRPSMTTTARIIEKNPVHLQMTYDDGVIQCRKVLGIILQKFGQTPT